MCYDNDRSGVCYDNKENCLLIFVCFVCLCIPLICIIMGICALHVFLQVVKRFEFPEVLYKFSTVVININEVQRHRAAVKTVCYLVILVIHR